MSIIARNDCRQDFTRCLIHSQVQLALGASLTELQKNWQSVIDEIHALGDRLSEAAKAAWNVLTQPKSSDSWIGL